MFLFLSLLKNLIVMKVIAKNSKVRSTLNGIISAYAGGGIQFTFRIDFYGGSRSQGNLIFSDLSELTDYLLDDCGYDSLTFRKI